MKSFREMRQEAWKKVSSRWLFRLLCASAVLGLIGSSVSGAVRQYFAANEITTWTDFCQTSYTFMKAGLTLTVPSAQQFWSMTQASCFQQFLMLLFNGISAYGAAIVCLKAIRNDESRWLVSAFRGFRIPLSVLLMNFLAYALITIGLMLFIVPGVIAALMLSLRWYVRDDHPDYTAVQCLAESARLMKGHKLRLLLFLLSYFGWLLVIGAAGVLAAVSANAFQQLVFLVPVAIGVVYIALGRAVFYEDLKSISENKTDHSATAVES